MSVKLICGIIATRESNTNSRSCDDFKKEWLKVIEKNNKLNNIEFFFIYSCPNVDSITIDGMDFIVPGNESKKTILYKTIQFFKYIVKEFPECTHVLRTNLSSFYNFPLLLTTLRDLNKKEIVFGSKERYNGYADFPSGCGTTYSIDVIHGICEYFKGETKDVLRKGKAIEHDDLAIGEILRKLKIKIINLDYVNLQRLSKDLAHIKDFIDGVKLKADNKRTVSFKPWFIEKIKNENKIHYRCSNPEFKFIFKNLIEKYY